MNRFASAPWPLKAAYLLTAAAMLAALAAAFGVLIALAGLRQLSGQIDLTKAPAWLWYYRADPAVERWTKIGALGGGAGLLVVGVGLAQGLRRPLHGQAHWASEAEIAAAGLRDPYGIILGRARGRYLIIGGAEHVMLYAPTRTGKGVGVVIPNLLNWPGSVIVLDVKRENWAATAGFRAAHGQAVLLFDPLAPNGATARYNPLAHIDRGDPTATLDELQRIATMLFPAPERGDPFWAEAARTGFIGVGALVAETPQWPFTLGEIFRQLTTDNPKARLSQLITERAREDRALSRGCVSALSDFCAASDNTFASIRQTLTARMGLWLNPLVDEATASSDFDLRDLRDKRLSIYLGATPENLVRVAPLYNLLLQQLVDLNTRRLPPPGTDQRQVLVMLDEFARLGHAGVIAHGFSFVAGYGLRFVAVLQSPAQLRAEYGPDLADEIMTNCGVEVVFAPKDIRTAQTLSERLGYYGQAAISQSRPRGFSSGRRSISEADQRRALMLPQELLALAPRELIVLRAGAPPVRGAKLVYYRERAFRKRLLPPPIVSPRPAPLPPAPRDPRPPLDARSRRKPPTRRRPMTPREAAGEASLSLEQISLALSPDDLAVLDDPAVDAEQVEAWAARYLDRAAFEDSLIDPSPIDCETGGADGQTP